MITWTHLLDAGSALLALLVLWDVFITVFSPNGAGPLTRLWTGPLWKALLWIHWRRPLPSLLSLAGPAMLIVSIITWYALLSLSLAVTLWNHPGSVISNATGLEARPPEKLYFVSTTISSLGYGDFVPSGLPWTVLSTLTTLVGTIVLTTSLSYVLAVLAASIERRKLAQSIFALGRSTPEILRTAQLGDERHSLQSHLIQIASQIETQALKHVAYPILKFFRTLDPESSSARAVLHLSDAVFLMEHIRPQYQAAPGVQRLLHRAIAHYVESAHSSALPPPNHSKNVHHLKEAALQLGMPPDTEPEFTASLRHYQELRNELVSLCWEEGWKDH